MQCKKMEQEEILAGVSPEKLSKINSAALINLRINNLLIDANNHSRKGEYSSWNADLDCVWRELGGNVKENSEEFKKIGEINIKLGKVSPISNWKGEEGFTKISKDDLEKQNKQYQLLTQKELFLRGLQDKKGMGRAYQESWDDYIDK